MGVKRFEELGLKDDFMFKAVMLNQDLCRRMLEIILDEKIRKIRYVEEQKAYDIAYSAKGIRLDV